MARFGEATQAGQGKARQGEAWQGVAGMARQGPAGHGVARRGLARRREAGLLALRVAHEGAQRLWPVVVVGHVALQQDAIPRDRWPNGAVKFGQLPDGLDERPVS